jgi:hypothetical protein
MPPEITDPVIEKQLEKVGAGLKKTKTVDEPLYRVVGDSRIPVSKSAGVTWKSRRDHGMSCRGKSKDNWDEAIRYYDNDQSIHRNATDGASGNRPTRRLDDGWTETENVVFANCSIMVPMLYAKNPHVTVSSNIDANEARARGVERLINKLLSQRTAPGLNFKAKARRAVLTALLTNNAFVKIGWTQKQDSSEVAINQLQELATRLENAKSKKDIIAVEGEIMALEEKISLLTPSGPTCVNKLPHNIVVDPTAEEPDGSDAQWMMEWDYLPTSYINAVYTTKDGEQQKSIYEPTHVMNVSDASEEGINSAEEAVNNFSLIGESFDAATHGYDNERAYKLAQYTKVWYVWDKTTRRVLMFADNKWTWPIWVWDDPLRLPRFFPYFRLWFHESVNENAPKGEVSYYLDQQDAINEIASEVRRGRQWARRNILYNKNVINQQDVESVLKGDDGTARGIALPEGSKLEDHIFSFVPPGLKMPEFFSPDSKFAAINRITGINDSMRGAQFKTNTTNKAVQTYQQNVDIRVDERVDLIEDFIGDIAWNIAMLCLMNWTAEDVAPMIGPELASTWVQVTDNREFDALFAARVEGGSIAKPNSREKKEQAMQLAQALGQFANAAPAVVIVMMKMLERSFDEVVISDEEWKMIISSMEQALMKAGSGPGGDPAQQGAPQQEQPLTDEELMAQVQERIRKLPPAAQAKLEELVQSGMPPAEALDQIEAELQPS